MSLKPGQPRESRVHAVLAATVGELVETGYASLTLDAIATAAHASKATIYKSWPSKIDLVCAVAAGLRPVAVPVPTARMSLVEAIASIALAVREVTVGETGRLLLALHEASRAEARVADAVNEHLVFPLRAAIAHALRSLQDEARVAAHIDADLGAEVVVALIIDRALVNGKPVRDDELEQIVVQWLVPALTTRATTGRALRPSAGPG